MKIIIIIITFTQDVSPGISKIIKGTSSWRDY